MSPEELLDYGQLTQNALRGVVREALRATQRLGRAPGEHHFYITFDTEAPDVEMSDALKEKYPEEMTIVLQHQFWDLEVLDNQFSVVLKFKGDPESLTVPFAAVTKFFDPSVQFGLQFDLGDPPDDPEPGEDDKTPAPTDKSDAAGEVVSLDAFRKK